MQPDEGFVLREWTCQNITRFEEKEKREKKLRSQISEGTEGRKRAFISLVSMDLLANTRLSVDDDLLTDGDPKLYPKRLHVLHKCRNPNHWLAIGGEVIRT
ncbi:hypothetical protein U1Q18_008587 [Sarracenia purpurea var. burkii]